MKVNIELIKSKRNEKGISMQEMAECLSLSDVSQYWKRENGHYNFKPTELPIISSKLEIPFHDLFLSTQYSKIEIDSAQGVG